MDRQVFGLIVVVALLCAWIALTANDNQRLERQLTSLEHQAFILSSQVDYLQHELRTALAYESRARERVERNVKTVEACIADMHMEVPVFYSSCSRVSPLFDR